MIERPFGYDPITGQTETFFYDELSGDWGIRTTVDEQPVLEANQDIRKEFRGPGGGKWQGDFHRVASVPMGVYYEKLVKTGKSRDQKELRKFLDLSENQVFRTRPGRLSK